MNNTKKCVTTLPISPVENPGLGLIIAPLLANVFSKRLDMEGIIALNLNGMKLESSKIEKNVSGYLEGVHSLEINLKNIWRDDNSSHLSLIEEFFKQLKSEGHIKREKRLLLKCPCGAFESLAEAENVSKSRNICYSEGGKIYCKLCKGQLQKFEKSVFLFTHPDAVITGDVYPKFYQQEINAMSEKFKGKDFLISKSRSSAIKISYQDEETPLDVDFVWQMFLPSLYRCGYDPQIVIGSNKNIMAAYFSSLIMRLLQQTSPCLVIPPYYYAPSKKKLNSEEYSCEKVLENYSAKTIKLFLASALNWKKKESILDWKLLSLISKMSYRIHSAENNFDIESVFSDLNNIKFSEILSIIRRSRNKFFVKEFFGLI